MEKSVKGGYVVKILVQALHQFTESFQDSIAEELNKNSHYKRKSEDKILMTESMTSNDDKKLTCTIIYNFE